MNIAVIGLSHKTAPVEIREKLSVPDPQMEAAIQNLCDRTHIQEATILSTCNRLEIYIVSPTADRPVHRTDRPAERETQTNWVGAER